MSSEFAEDLAAIAGIKAIPTILEIVCRTTGMRFAAVARVTEDRWIACSVCDSLDFGLAPGDELQVETTICNEIRRTGQAVIIDHAARDPNFRDHHTMLRYRLQSYISMPIRLSDGRFFGTLCAIDPEPQRVNTPEIVAMFQMFAEIIGFQLSAVDKAALAEARLLEERRTSALREQFIAVLGHDLRNPLTAISGGMEMLQRTPLNEKAARIAGMIRGSVERMTDLIDNVMDFSRGRLGGGLAVERCLSEPVDDILRQVVEELQTGAPEREIRWHFAVGTPIHCDRQRLAQLASNLLGNALTYGAPNRPVEIGASIKDGCFELYVANAGEPIPQPIMDRIFEPFSRGAMHPNRQGLGLGLYISHQIALAHGGELSVTSTAEETRFTFRMPLD